MTSIRNLDFDSTSPSLSLSLSLSSGDQAFGQAYSTQRKVAEDGESNEATLLQESATKEAYYMGRLLELQAEVKLCRSNANGAQADSEHLSGLLQEIREVGEEQEEEEEDTMII